MTDEPKKKRNHRATYARDKRKGGYLIRVAGPNADMFAGRSVPVSLKNGSEQMEELEAVIWSGKDDETGENVCLYKFKPKPLEKDDITF